jgi:hypothetical protein
MKCLLSVFYIHHNFSRSSVVKWGILILQITKYYGEFHTSIRSEQKVIETISVVENRSVNPIYPLQC